MAIPKWDDIQLKMTTDGLSTDAIAGAKADYDSRFGSASPAPVQSNVLPATTNKGTVNFSGGSTFLGMKDETFNPVVEELKKSTEMKVNAENTIRMVDKVWAAANDLIPAMDAIKIGELQIAPHARALGVVKETAAKFGFDEATSTWNDVKGGFTRQIIRGLGEKGMLAEGDIADAEKLLPTAGDSTFRRAKKSEVIKSFLLASVEAYTQRWISLNPDMQNHIKSLDPSQRRELLQSINLPGGTAWPQIGKYISQLEGGKGFTLPAEKVE